MTYSVPASSNIILPSLMYLNCVQVQSSYPALKHLLCRYWGW